MSISLTERAVQEIKKVMEEQNMVPDNHVLRVAVAGGGCAGFQYQLEFETKDEGDALNDSVYEFFGLSAKVDRKSELYLEGTTIDFHEGLDKRGFTFNNPQATKGCGCGQSFTA